MKPISVQWTEGVSFPEARVVLEGIARAIEAAVVTAANAGIGLGRAEIRPFGTWHIPGIQEGSPYWSTLWYVSQSLDESSGTLIGPKFIETIRREPWQQVGPHYDVAIVHYDLRDQPESMVSEGGSSFALSSTARNLAAVISVNRLRHIGDDTLFRRALRRLTVHSFGHILEAPREGRTRAAEFSFGAQHCTNPCVMRHPRSVAELIELARGEREAGTMFCEDCAADILEHTIRNHFSRN